MGLVSWNFLGERCQSPEQIQLLETRKKMLSRKLNLIPGRNFAASPQIECQRILFEHQWDLFFIVMLVLSEQCSPIVGVILAPFALYPLSTA